MRACSRGAPCAQQHWHPRCKRLQRWRSGQRRSRGCRPLSSRRSAPPAQASATGRKGQHWWHGVQHRYNPTSLSTTSQYMILPYPCLCRSCVLLFQSDMAVLALPYQPWVCCCAAQAMACSGSPAPALHWAALRLGLHLRCGAMLGRSSTAAPPSTRGDMHLSCSLTTVHATYMRSFLYIS